MTTPGVTTPYSTVRPYMPAALPQWLNEYDALRITSYKTYEDIYWGNPDAFKLVIRGTNDRPIYVPSGRVIVNTMNRYTGKNPRVVLDPGSGQTADQALALQAISDLFTRERFVAQYNSNKRFGLIRGDWCFHVLADPAKPQGKRITIKGIDPGSIFPITEATDVDRVLGWDIAEQVIDGDKTLIVRQRYLKSDHPDRGLPPGGTITYQKDVLEVEGWETPQAKRVASRTYVAVPSVELPPAITALPVYHIRNFEEPQNPFGASELRGMERIIAGINQAITDEDLTLALQGIGLYFTDAGAPVNEAGEEVPWRLGPGEVVEVGTGKTFGRVQGVTTVGPFQDHIAYLHDQLGRVSGASDVAQGVVDVTVAESGVALALRMGPIITEAEDKDVGIKSTLDQMLFDLLTGWFPAYESQTFADVRGEFTFGSKLPEDKAKKFDQLLQMFNSNLISGAYFRDAVRELGFDIPLEMGADILEEQQAAAEALDPAGARLEAEANALSLGEDELDDGEA